MFSKKILVLAAIFVLATALLPMTAALAGSPTPQGITHVVQPGDTVWGLGQRYGVSWQKICEANGLDPAGNCRLIWVGQVIFLPHVASTSSSEAPVNPPTPPPQPKACVSEAQVRIDLKLLANVKVVKTGDQWSTPSEPCKFQIPAGGAEHVVVTMADRYQFTATMNPGQEVVVFYGDGKARDIQGSTVRYLDSYPAVHWVWRTDRLISHEFNFGVGQGRLPRYATQPGNFTVAGWNAYDGSYCPQTSVQTAALVGGEMDYWSPPTWSGGAWPYAVPRDTNGNPIAFHVLTAAEPWGTNARIDFWNGQTGKADVLDNWASLPLADASYHCYPIDP